MSCSIQPTSLAHLDASDVATAIEIVDLLGANCRTALTKLPVLAKDATTTTTLTLVSRVCATHVVAGGGSSNKHQQTLLLPCVDVPEHALELASRLGIATRLDAPLGVKVLERMVERRVRDEEAYVDWLLRLKLHLNETSDDVRELVAHKALLYVKTNSDDKDDKDDDGFVRVGDVYLNVEADDSSSTSLAMRLVCSYLGKCLLHVARSPYKQCDAVLRRLGARHSLSALDVRRTLAAMSLDRTLFFKETNILLVDAYERFRILYAKLEDLLLLDDDEGDDDKQPTKDKEHISMDGLVIITHDRHLIRADKLYGQTVCVCFQVRHKKEKESSYITLVVRLK